MKAKTPLTTLFVLCLLAVFSGASYAHSGGTDKNGCHKDHKNGGYHCH